MVAGTGRIVVLVSLALLTFGLATAAQAKRVALVVGNDKYENVPGLDKAVNDARAIAHTLQELGFEVILAKDVTRRAMNQKVQDLANKIRPGDQTLFFYSGHGVQMGGHNYLLPTDIPLARPGQEEFIRAEAVSVDHVLDTILGRGARVAILILDACRNNPFPKEGERIVGGETGLARMVAPEGAFIVYSAGEGQEALDGLTVGDKDPNSVFTRNLIPLLKVPGLKLNDTAREVRRQVQQIAGTVNHEQRPAYYDGVTDDFYFTRDTRATVRETQEETLWESIKDSDKPSVFEFYIKQFPQGRYVALAKLRIFQLKQQKVAGAFPMPADQRALKPSPPESEREKERLEKARQEKERIAREAREAEAERAEKERLDTARQEKERIAREAREAEAKRTEKERLETARQEKERIAREVREAEAKRADKERQETARQEKERIAREAEAKRAEEERLETARQEKERIVREAREAKAKRAEDERLETERREKERADREAREAEAKRAEKERLEKERQEAEAKRLEEERAAKKTEAQGAAEGSSDKPSMVIAKLTPEEAPEKAGLEPEQRSEFVRKIQTELREKKCYKGAVNGTTDDGEGAIKALNVALDEQGQSVKRIEIRTASRDSFESWLEWLLQDLKNFQCEKEKPKAKPKPEPKSEPKRERRHRAERRRRERQRSRPRQRRPSGGGGMSPRDFMRGNR